MHKSPHRPRALESPGPRPTQPRPRAPSRVNGPQRRHRGRRDQFGPPRPTKMTQVRDQGRLRPRPDLIYPPPGVTRTPGPRQHLSDFGLIQEDARLDIDDNQATVALLQKKVRSVSPSHIAILAAQPKRLRSDPDDVRIEVGQPQAVQLQTTLIRHMPARCRRPEQACVMPLAGVRPRNSDRQPGRGAPPIDRPQIRHDRCPVVGKIPNLDVKKSPSAHTPETVTRTRN